MRHSDEQDGLPWSLGSREESGQMLNRNLVYTVPVVTDMTEESAGCSGSVSLGT